jgi:hypothetical protein
MSAALFAGIDWQRPWLAPFRACAQPIVAAADWQAALNARAADMGLRNHRDLPLRFVPQASLPPGMAYEAFISASGGVPTRENLHDFFNGLVWLTFPRIKVQLNALQAGEIERAKNHGPAARGAVRDAATLFDENTALLVVRDGDWIDALRAHRWSELFVARRAEFSQNCEVYLFGHALMEKLIAPYKAITAHVWPLVAEAGFFALSPLEKQRWLDAAVSAQIKDGFSTRDFTPLPILGVPDWWEAQDKGFYADAAVFRPKRAGSSAG